MIGAPPDVVYIALGGNDWAAENGAPPTLAAFGAKYSDLIALVRSKYPQAHNIGSVAASLTDDYPDANDAYSNMKTALDDVVKARNAAGDAKVHAHELPRANQSQANGAPDLTGCEYHSNVASHQKLGAAVVTKIKAVTGWP